MLKLEQKQQPKVIEQYNEMIDGKLYKVSVLEPETYEHYLARSMSVKELFHWNSRTKEHIRKSF